MWLAQEIHGPLEGVMDLVAHWKNVQAMLRQPLPAKVLLTNREAIGTAFSEWLGKANGELAVKAASPAEVVAVFCAWVLSIEPDEQDRIASRAIIVEQRDAWRALTTSRQPLILVASPRLEVDAELVVEAVRQGHHVLRFAEFRTPRNMPHVELPMMRRFDLQETLAREAGLPESEA